MLDTKNNLAILLYEKMFFLRKSEEAIDKLYRMQKINGFCHLYIGQEAIAAAFVNFLMENDTIITSYRCHGFALICGVELKVLIAELLGKVTGASKGLGGSMHIFSPKNRFYGGHGIVGAQVSIGTGIAFAHKYNNNNGISYCLFGDGALNQGQVYESFNMAALWGLPVVYIIENNVYAMGTHYNKGCANSKNLNTRGESFGIIGMKVDGMDVFAVRDALQNAAEYCRAKKMPILLEMETYRYKGHSMSDPMLYRTKEELLNYKSHDSLNRILLYIEQNNILNEDEIEIIKDRVIQYVKDAVKWAEESDMPNKEILSELIYKN